MILYVPASFKLGNRNGSLFLEYSFLKFVPGCLGRLGDSAAGVGVIEVREGWLLSISGRVVNFECLLRYVCVCVCVCTNLCKVIKCVCV